MAQLSIFLMLLAGSGVYLAQFSLLLAMLLAGGGGWQAIRWHHKRRLETRLHLEASGLDIEERLDELTEHRLEIPWQELLSLQPETENAARRSTQLRYRKKGRKRRYRLGRQLQANEQDWLRDQIQTWRRLALNEDPQKDSDQWPVASDP
jgi:hypothetical protein